MKFVTLIFGRLKVRFASLLGKASLTLCLDIFFPRSCLGCGRDGTHICARCEESLIYPAHQNSLSTPFIDKVFIACEYRSQNLIGKLIKRIKYKFSEELAEVLARTVLKNMGSAIDWKSVKILIPVPLSNDRLKWRGFNQAELISEKIARMLSEEGYKVKVDASYLKKVKSTTAQAACKSRYERLQNVRMAFAIDHSIHPPKN